MKRHKIVEGTGYTDVTCPKTKKEYRVIICCPNTNYVKCPGCGEMV